MKVDGRSFTVTRKKPFKPMGQIRPTTIATVTKFAFDMTYGAKGQHRNHRSGGSAKRTSAQIFCDTFQGKLSEFALANIIYKVDGFAPPDTSTYELGVWESADFSLGNNSISVKSTKFFGNLLLLEKSDWDIDGRYVLAGEDPKSYTHIVLIRIYPDIEELIKPRNSVNESNYELLLKSMLAHKWEYEIAGFITSEDLKEIIKLRHEIPKGSLLNGKVVMDASNYYVQAACLRGQLELVNSFDIK